MAKSRRSLAAGHHGDAPAQHIDSGGGPHLDSSIPPHGDTELHIDAPGGPHTDAGGNHVDFSDDGKGGEPHQDFKVPHVDLSLPAHHDTSPHVDTPAGPHTDSPSFPHVDEDVSHADGPLLK